MKLKNYILSIVAIFMVTISFSNEKFVKVKGVLLTKNEALLTNYSVKIVLDDIDSSITEFDKENFSVWLPANRKAKVSFIKDGYKKVFMIVDASFIPSFAYKKKQTIDLKVKMIKEESSTKKRIKPFCIAKFKSSEVKFVLKYPETEKKALSKKFRPPFPSPVSIFKGAKPMNRYLKSISEYNKDKADDEHAYYSLVQGVLFSNLNYNIFNERIDRANQILIKLVDINKSEWKNIKPFDTPEYGVIVMKTLNNEKTRDTLFALGAWIGTSQLVMQSFTSNSKLIIHGKKLIYTLKYYKESGLSVEQKEVVEKLRNISILYDELIKKYMSAMKNRTPLKLIEDELFIQIKNDNQLLYNLLIE